MSATSQVSEAQLAANRANAQLSTGPRSEAGKAKAALNAVKTGLTGRLVYFTEEEAPKYEMLRQAYFEELNPVGVLEAALVQSILDCRWRLEKIPALENTIVTQRLLQKAWKDLDADQHNLSAFETFIRADREKELRNLQLQEARLSRRHDKDMAALRQLQAERKAAESAEMQRAAEARLVAEHRKQPFSLQEIGFEFSKEAFDRYFAKLTHAQKQILLERGLQNAPPAAKSAA